MGILISLLIYKELGKGGKSLFLPQSIARTDSPVLTRIFLNFKLRMPSLIVMPGNQPILG